MVSNIFKRRDKEYDELPARKHLARIRDSNTAQISEFIPIPTVFDETESATGYNGVMPILAKMGNQYFATNCIIDPLHRLPPLGKTGKTWVQKRGQFEFPEEIEQPRGLTTGLDRPLSAVRYSFKAIGQKIGSYLGSDLSFTNTGRTLINGAELLKLQDSSTLGEISLLQIPWSHLKPTMQGQVFQQMLHDTTYHGPKNISGGYEDKIMSILSAHGLDKSRWSMGVIILTSRPELYNSDEEFTDLWEDQAKKTLEDNVYKTPVLVDMSVVEDNWRVKIVTPAPELPVPKRGIGKRPAYDTSIFEDPKEKRLEISLEGIRDQIANLNTYFNEFLKEPNSTRQMKLLTQHAELASELQEQCQHAQHAQQLKIQQFENDISDLTKKLTGQRTEHEKLISTIEAVEAQYQHQTEEKSIVVANLEAEIQKLQSKDEGGHTLCISLFGNWESFELGKFRISSFDFEFRFRVSSSDFEFRVPISTSDFELRFRVSDFVRPNFGPV